jgi:formylglycine-generating enzyme required for sulfatase activity
VQAPPSASASVAVPPKKKVEGPCGEKPAGAYACDGKRLLKCTGAEGAFEEVQRCLDIERCSDVEGACAGACPEGEVYIPATGAKGFIMGTGVSGRVDVPHKVVLTKPFCMDATEVTVSKMIECVKEKGCKEPKREERWATYPRKPDYPVNMVNWSKAKLFCEKNGKSLPSEAQWEWAATGGTGRKWPWGDDPPTCERADFTKDKLVSPGGDSGCHGGGPSAVGTHPLGAKEWPSGKIHDLAGNVWEWCLDNFAPYSGKDEVDPVHLKAEAAPHIVRGGGWNRSWRGILSSYRGSAIYTYQVPGLGFRCVRNPGP